MVGITRSKVIFFHPYFWKIPILTNIFQMGWNHQLVRVLILHDFIFYDGPRLSSDRRKLGATVAGLDPSMLNGNKKQICMYQALISSCWKHLIFAEQYSEKTETSCIKLVNGARCAWFGTTFAALAFRSFATWPMFLDVRVATQSKMHPRTCNQTIKYYWEMPLDGNALRLSGSFSKWQAFWCILSFTEVCPCHGAKHGTGIMLAKRRVAMSFPDSLSLTQTIVT